MAKDMYIVYGTHSFRMSENKCWILHTSLGKG